MRECGLDLKIGFKTNTAQLDVNFMFFFDINVGIPLKMTFKVRAVLQLCSIHKGLETHTRLLNKPLALLRYFPQGSSQLKFLWSCGGLSPTRLTTNNVE